MKRATLAWAVGAGLVTAWVVLGFFFDQSPTALRDLAGISQAATTIAPAAFVALYTVLGLLGGAKWWRTDVGTNIVWLEIGVFSTSAILAWAFIFNHGELTSPVLGWAYIGGLFGTALITAWRSVIWLRADLWARHRDGTAGK